MTKKIKFKCFSLIELIIVFTILILLITLSMYYLNKWMIKSRDSVRMWDLTMIQSALESYSLINWDYPSPDKSKTILDTWNQIAWYQWEFGSKIKWAIRRYTKLSLDLRWDDIYEYSVTNNFKKYQLKVNMETTARQMIWDEIFMDFNVAEVVGNYNWFLLTNNWAEYSLWQIPSLFLVDSEMIFNGMVWLVESEKPLSNMVIISSVDVTNFFDNDALNDKNVFTDIIEAFSGKINTIDQAKVVLKDAVGDKIFNVDSTKIWINGKCGLSNLKTFIRNVVPTQDLCTIWSWSSVSVLSWSYKWTCSGDDLWIPDICIAYKWIIIWSGNITEEPNKWADWTYASSCDKYKNPLSPYSYTGAVLWSGTYIIDPDLTGNIQPLEAYCDMSSAWWPWTWPYDRYLSGYINRTPLLVQSETTSWSTTFSDSSINNLTITNLGNAVHSTKTSKFGSSSLYFDGNGSYLKTANSTWFNFWASPFSIDFWVKINNSERTETLFMHGTWIDKNEWSIFMAHFWERLVLGISNNWTERRLLKDVTEWNPDPTKRYHIALVRTPSNTLKIFIDWVYKNSWILADGESFFTPTTNNNFLIWRDIDWALNPLDGYIEEFRVVNWWPLRLYDFEPPKVPYKYK